MTPWWNTPWVAVPIFVAAGVGGAFLAAMTRARPSPPLCPGLTTDGGVLDGVEYVERRSGGAQAGETLPMLVVFHPPGLTAEHMAELATAISTPARVIAPRAFHETAGHGLAWRDPTGKVPFDEDVGSLANFLEQVRRCRPTQGLPVLAGYDQGADVAFQVAVDDPGLVAAVVGAGGTPPAQSVRAPTVVLHGMKDAVVPYEATHEAWLAQIALNAPVRFLRMFGVDHSFAGALQIKLWLEAQRLLTDPYSRPFS